MTKTEIRKQMKGLNTALSSEQREELSARIFNEAERLPAFARAKVVALFASLKDEPLTAPALERWSRSKRIVLPRVEGDIMRFYDYDPASMNDSGSFGISEPEPLRCAAPRRSILSSCRVWRSPPQACAWDAARDSTTNTCRSRVSGLSRQACAIRIKSWRSCPPIRSTFRSITFAADGKTSADFGPTVKSDRSHVFSEPKTYPFGIPPSKTGKHRLRQRIVKRENTASKKPASTDAGFLTNINYYR